MQKNTSVKIGYSAAIFAAILAGSISTVAKPVLSDIHPILLASLVCFLIALVTTPLTTRKKHVAMNKKDWYLVLLISIFGAILAPIFFYGGLKQTTASDTALLSNSEMIFTILLAVVLFKEKLKPIGYVAVGIVMIGVIIVTTNL
ncbi:MAG: DMT family transporter [Rhabdochlamydiaceae bacterium]